ncbi:ParA family protein [Phragmitibacter flavus]|uniref:ParA family protein n=1 Tax=Phragmitibacter flavus TaxID=2576071 RepID=A0A5R8KBS1_9BACT|nr:ParA family protein [Phragmitibacter flavus]TLD69736.1 ParA family protein [Phragmitibacter flavus]
MAAKAIAFINFKGGVGKTAATVNLGAALAYHEGKKVLIVDLDAQCNSSFWLMQPHAWRDHIKNGKHSTYQIFQDHLQGTKLFNFEQSTLFGMPRREVPLIKNLDLLPAAVELIKIEDSIQQSKHTRYFEILQKTLEPHYQDYDYIFFDCPPNIYSVTKNALFAADYCVIPYLPDFLSLAGFQVFAKLVDEFNDKVASHKKHYKKASIAAVIVSHFRIGLKDHERNLMDLSLILSHLRGQKLVHNKAALLTPPVRYNVKVAESTNAHQPVILYDPGSIGADDYRHLAKSFHYHFNSLP